MNRACISESEYAEKIYPICLYIVCLYLKSFPEPHRDIFLDSSRREISAYSNSRHSKHVQKNISVTRWLLVLSKIDLL